ncbi:unnamed protein product [Boreogadus saida]
MNRHAPSLVSHAPSQVSHAPSQVSHAPCTKPASGSWGESTTLKRCNAIQQHRRLTVERPTSSPTTGPHNGTVSEVLSSGSDRSTGHRSEVTGHRAPGSASDLLKPPIPVQVRPGAGWVGGDPL